MNIKEIVDVDINLRTDGRFSATILAGKAVNIFVTGRAAGTTPDEAGFGLQLDEIDGFIEFLKAAKNALSRANIVMDAVHQGVAALDNGEIAGTSPPQTRLQTALKNLNVSLDRINPQKLL